MYCHFDSEWRFSMVVEVEEKFNQDGSINQNWIAERIAVIEGKKEEVNIAQIKEILKITLDILATDFSESEVSELLEKHR